MQSNQVVQQPVRLQDMELEIQALLKQTKSLFSKKDKKVQEHTQEFVVLLKEILTYVREEKRQVQEKFTALGKELLPHLKVLNINKEDIFREQKPLQYIKQTAAKYQRNQSEEARTAGEQVLKLVNSYEATLEEIQSDVKDRFKEFKTRMSKFFR